MQKKIGFAIIGCGRIAKNHFQSIQEIPEAVLVAGCDIDEKALENCRQQYNCLTYDNYHALLANPDINVVNICTPSGLHARIAIDALNAGKHVIVEKPMAMSLKEADAMLAAAKANDKKLAVVHQNRFNPAIIKTRQVLEQGRFGKLTHGSAVVRWNRNDDYYRQACWRGTWEQDGGCLMNQSIHNIDLLQWMFGPVQSVFAYTSTNLRQIQGEDVAVAALRFANGALGIIEASVTLYPNNLEETLNIFGATGTVVIGGMAVNKIEAWRFAGEEEAAALEEQFKEPPNVYGFGHSYIISNMIQAIREERQPAVCGEEGRKALEIILAIYHSVRYKQEITLPLEERFTIGIGI